ncbi:MAG: hypothetical protein J0L75_10600 [Spirochaetes bacterium]|nr:hypothetical protein [Spirochaetota bacterium]
MQKTRNLLQPVTDAEHLLLLQEVRILREYQAFIRRALPQLTKAIPVMRVKEALPHVRRILEHGGDGVDRTLHFKNRQHEYLRDWERREKIHLASRVGPKDQVGRLLKIADILTAVKKQLN